MADKYLKAGATGTGDGSSWANAFTNWTAAFAGTAAGDTLRVSRLHVDATIPSTSTTYTCLGTIAAPCLIVSVDEGTGTPTQGAQIASTGAGGITMRGHFKMDGVNFNLGDGANVPLLAFANNAGDCQYYSNMDVNINATGANVYAQCGSDGAICIFEKNVKVKGSTANSYVRATASAFFIWRDSPVPYDPAGAIPSSIIGNAGRGRCLFENVDFSIMSGKSLMAGSATTWRSIRLSGCKLPASFTIGSILNRSDEIDLAACSSDGSDKEIFVRARYAGSEVLERTVVRTGGANNGIDAISGLIVTSAGALRHAPYEGRWNAFYVNPAEVGIARTLTVHTLMDNVTATDAELSVELAYLGDAGSLRPTIKHDGPINPLVAPIAQPLDNATAWTTTGLSTPVKQKLEVPFTPANNGLYAWRIRVGRPSSTVYYCLKGDLL